MNVHQSLWYSTMPQNTFTPQLQRMVGQIRFRPTLATFGSTYLMAEKLDSKFKEWKAEGSNILLYTLEEKKFIEVGSDRVTYLNEKDIYNEELPNYFEKVFEVCKNKPLSVRKVRRVGIRVTQLFKSAFEFNDVVDLLYKKFYHDTERINEISAETVRDVIYVLDGEKNGFMNHVQIGPTKKDDGLTAFKPNFEMGDREIGDSNLFIDIDVFTIEGLSLTNTIEKLKAIIQENKRIMESYFNYIDS